MRNSRRMLTAASVAAILSASAWAQVGPTATSSGTLIIDDRANTYTPSELNAAPRQGARADRVRAFLDQRGAAADKDNLVLIQEHRGKTGRVHQRFEQVLEGRRVYGASVKASFSDDGEILSISERLSRKADRRLAMRLLVTPEEALDIARQHHFPDAPVVTVAGTEGMVTTFRGDPYYYGAPEVEEIAIARKNGISVGYLVKQWKADTNELFHTVIGPLGEIVHVEDRTSRDQYGIFPDHPGNSSQVVRNGPGSGNAESPNGWLNSGTQSSVRIRGNNVYAYLDVNANNSPDTGGRSISNGVFTTAASLSSDPGTSQNREVAVQNLFYWNNVIHDVLYSHGFTESAGNFQENNFGKGGAGSDSVNAEAQDGSGTNNANFATPGDGSNPRMQMFLWNLTNPWRDGDLDSDIIWHEYGHGLTWRMIGNMSGSVSGAIGEGMSDVLAILQNNDDRVGEYSANNANGIRSARYTNYPKTIGDFTGSSVHRDGEIYAATIWRLKQVFEREGLTIDDLMDTLIEGMNFTPSSPDYLEMRDGLLAGAPSSQDCLIWEAFADFGMGQGATFSTFSIGESFSEPSTCSGGGGGDPDPDPGAGAQLTGFTGSSRNYWWYWYATANFTVTNGGSPVSGTVVTFNWDGSGGSCTTNSSGQCSTNSPLYSRNTSRANITVETIGGQPAVAGPGVPLSGYLSRP